MKKQSTPTQTSPGTSEPVYHDPTHAVKVTEQVGHYLQRVNKAIDEYLGLDIGPFDEETYELAVAANGDRIDHLFWDRKRAQLSRAGMPEEVIDAMIRPLSSKTESFKRAAGILWKSRHRAENNIFQLTGQTVTLDFAFFSLADNRAVMQDENKAFIERHFGPLYADTGEKQKLLEEVQNTCQAIRSLQQVLNQQGFDNTLLDIVDLMDEEEGIKPDWRTVRACFEAL